MAKSKSGAKRLAAKKKPLKQRMELLKNATQKVATAAAKLAKAASKVATGAPAKKKPSKRAAIGQKPTSAGIALVPPGREVPKPRATKLPPVGELLTKREMEQLLTAGQGRGVVGEGSLKGRLLVKDGLPYLSVIGRDKRELMFLLQGPDQEVLPAYVDHKVSVSGLLKKTNNYGGTVDVRKYSAKKVDSVPLAPEVPAEQKLRYLSPGEVEQLSNAGMGAGMKGFASLRGTLEMTGDQFFLVLSNGGTRQQVSFLLEAKNAKAIRKHVGGQVQATGVVEKTSGWGGRVDVETFEPRPAEYKAISRDGLEVVSLEGASAHRVEVKLNHGLSLRLPERAGYTWAIEPTTAKKLGLREANFEPGGTRPASREFFFTPRNPGVFEIDFFLAKVLSPAQVAKTFKIFVTVKP